MGLGDLRLHVASHAEHCNSCKDCTALYSVTDYKQVMSNWAQKLRNVTVLQHLARTELQIHIKNFLLHRLYLTDSSSEDSMTGSTRQEREANRIIPGFPQPFIPREGVRRGYPEEFTSEAPWVPSCHHLSVITESLMWLPIPASHTMSQLKNVSCAVGLPQELLFQARSQGRAG